MTVRLCVPELLGKGMVRAERASYLRRQVGYIRTLMQSVGSATFADQILTSVADRTRTKIADRIWMKIADRSLAKFADLTMPTFFKLLRSMLPTQSPPMVLRGPMLPRIAERSCSARPRWRGLQSRTMICVQ